MNNISFKEFLESNEDVLFVVSSSGSGKSSLVNYLKEELSSLYPYLKDDIKDYLYIYQYGDLIYRREILEDIAESSLERSNKILPIVYLDLYEEMNDYEKLIFHRYFIYPSQNNPYKLIITISPNHLSDFPALSQRRAIYLEEKDVIKELETSNILIVDNDINKSLLNYLYSYKKFSKDEIDIINASIIFGQGLISEYSFRNINRNHEEINEFLRYHDIIYSHQEDEDVPYYSRFIYFKHYSFYLFLKDYLKETIQKVANHYFKRYKDIDFTKIFDSIAPSIRLISLFYQDKETIYQYLLNKNDQDLLIEGYQIVNEEGYKIDIDEKFNEIFISSIYQIDDLKDKILGIIDLLDKDNTHLKRILHLINDCFNMSYIEMEDHASLLALTKKTFSKISELKDFNDIYDNEFIKSYLPILDILYHDEHDASIKEEIEILITNGLLNRVVDTYFYHDLLSYIPYLRAISSSDIKPLIDQYLTFNTYFDVVELFTMHHLTQEEVQIVYNNCIVINK